VKINCTNIAWFHRIATLRAMTSAFTCFLLLFWLTTDYVFPKKSANCTVLHSACVHDCLSAYPMLEYLKNSMSNLYKIFFTYYLWLWLGFPLMIIQHVVYSGPKVTHFNLPYHCSRSLFNFVLYGLINMVYYSIFSLLANSLFPNLWLTS